MLMYPCEPSFKDLYNGCFFFEEKEQKPFLSLESRHVLLAIAWLQLLQSRPCQWAGGSLGLVGMANAIPAMFLSG